MKPSIDHQHQNQLDISIVMSYVPHLLEGILMLFEFQDAYKNNVHAICLITRYIYVWQFWIYLPINRPFCDIIMCCLFSQVTTWSITATEVFIVILTNMFHHNGFQFWITCTLIWRVMKGDAINERMRSFIKMSIKIHKNKFEFLTKTYDEANILKYTGMIWKGYKIYVDVFKHPINEGFNNTNGWKDLHHILRLQAQSDGYDIVSNVFLAKTNPTNVEYAVDKVLCSSITRSTSLQIHIEVLHWRTIKKNSCGNIGCQMPCHNASVLPISPDIDVKCFLLFNLIIVAMIWLAVRISVSPTIMSSSIAIKCKQEHVTCQLLMWKALLTLAWLKPKCCWCQCFYVRSGQVISRSQVHYIHKVWTIIFAWRVQWYWQTYQFVLENQCHSHVVFSSKQFGSQQRACFRNQDETSSKSVNALQDLDEQEINEMHNYIVKIGVCSLCSLVKV